jgi:hypothetical protein
MTEIIFKEESYKIIGICMEVCIENWKWDLKKLFIKMLWSLNLKIIA